MWMIMKLWLIVVITDEGISTITIECRMLEELYLLGISCQLTEQCLVHIAANCKHIQKLGISHASNINKEGEGVKAVKQKCMQLNEFILNDRHVM